MAHLDARGDRGLIISHEDYPRKLARSAISGFVPNITVEDLEAEAMWAVPLRDCNTFSATVPTG